MNDYIEYQVLSFALGLMVPDSLTTALDYLLKPKLVPFYQCIWHLI